MLAFRQKHDISHSVDGAQEKLDAAGVLRDKPNIKWEKDRGQDVPGAPGYHLGQEYGGKEGDRINNHHLTLEEKKRAREEGNT